MLAAELHIEVLLMSICYQANKHISPGNGFFLRCGWWLPCAHRRLHASSSRSCKHGPRYGHGACFATKSREPAPNCKLHPMVTDKPGFGRASRPNHHIPHACHSLSSKVMGHPSSSRRVRAGGGAKSWPQMRTAARAGTVVPARMRGGVEQCAYKVLERGVCMQQESLSLDLARVRRTGSNLGFWWAFSSHGR